MSTPSFFEQIFARDPRQLARFPDAPLDQALSEWKKIQAAPVPPPPAPVPTPPAAPTPAAPNGAPAPSGDQIAQIATHVWRAKNRLLDPDNGQPREESQRIYRHIERTLDTLNLMGVVIRDHLNESYDPGLPVNVLTFQPMPGLSRDTVIEAVRPTVIWQERVLQIGEVVVGTPENSPASP
jgi:hypothetical protein